jgi:hypothetical protein
MRFIPEPLTVTCDTCGKSAQTFSGATPDLALECGCCPVLHDHAGLGCRTVTISAKARLCILDAGDLLEALADEHPVLPREPMGSGQGKPAARPRG